MASGFTVSILHCSGVIFFIQTDFQNYVCEISDCSSRYEHFRSSSYKKKLSRNRDRPPSKQWPEVIVRIIHKTPHKITSIFFQALGDAAFSFQFEGSEMVSCTFKCIGPSEGIPLCWYWAPWHHLRNGVQENFLVYTRPLIRGRFEK